MSYKEEYADLIEGQFFDLENRIMADIVRRIKKTGEITSTADYQIERLYDLFGFSTEEIEASIKEMLNASYPEMFELYDRVVEEEYTRNKAIYEQINGTFVPYDQNGQLQQWIEAAKRQTEEELKNITATMGFVSNIDGQMTFLPLTDFCKKTMDAAMLDITSGAFDYNSTLKRTVREMTNSGVRWIEYESGWHNRITVAARRAVMTGVSQLTGKINEMNAEKLGTEYFEIDWHAGARPSHAEWQGKVWSKKELVTVCGLGTVTGLNGANCYHTYYPFIPGISQRNYTDEWLEEQNRLENIPRTFKGKKYTAYEATQKQRQMETAMRAQREKIRHLEDGGADEKELLLQKCRYQGQLQEYSAFSKAMGLRQQRNRIYIDGLGNVVYGKRKSRVNMLTGGKTSKISAKTSIALKISSPGSTKSYKRSLLDIRNGKAGLDKRRQNILNRMPHTGDFLKLERDSISVRDLAYLSAATSNEFTLFRGKEHDIIVRGNSMECNIEEDLSEEIIKKHFKWIAHSHVDGGPLMASVEDRKTLHKLNQAESIIVGIDGEEIVFGQSLF